MIIEQRQWTLSGWNPIPGDGLGTHASLVLAFGGREVLSDRKRYDELWEQYPSAEIVLCSTSGEIAGINVLDDTIVATAVQFERSEVRTAKLAIDGNGDSYQCGTVLASAFPVAGLRHVLVLSDGLRINGSELVRGLNDTLPASVSVSGGLAGDGTRFERTLVGLNGPPVEGTIAAIGFYGLGLTVRHGTYGGWDSFGLDRVITRSERNVLYELDGQPALDLYKKYLGEQAAELPGSALRFPLSIRIHEEDEPVVRTILAVDEAHKSMTFAGDMPEGSFARLMKANFERIIDGSGRAAVNAAGNIPAELALLISCVGRKLVLGQRVEEEVERVQEVFGAATVLSGFYSYGELSPLVAGAKCDLHNQTMTITTFSEGRR